MRVSTSTVMPGSPQEVFDLVSPLEHWPELLPHYRYVTHKSGPGKPYRMSARRSGFPVSWISVYRPDPASRRLYFRHVGGQTRGMEVEWRLDPHPLGTHVTIEHEFASRWPVVGPLATWVICHVFVEHIAGKTLSRFRELAARRVQSV